MVSQSKSRVKLIRRTVNVPLFFHRIIRLIQTSLQSSLNHAEHQLVAMGAVGFIGFPFFYYVWEFVYPQPYENLWLRLLGSLLCFGLMFINQCPKSLQKYVPLYWTVAICYTLPFFFTFMLLKNHANPVSSLSALMSTFLLVVIVDWVSLSILSLIGFFLAWYFYWLTTNHWQYTNLHIEFLLIYCFTVVAGSIFNYKSSLLQSEKLEGMAAVSSTIAHELRTPLLGIQSGAVGLKRYFPLLFESYQLAKAAGVDVPAIRPAHYNALVPVLDRIEAETKYANTIIDMILMNVKKTDQSSSDETFSILNCVHEAVERYPFNSEKQRQLVSVQPEHAFEVRATKLLVVHVLFNLLKNALHFIAKAEKGEIYIRFIEDEQYNHLHFKDTGTGMNEQTRSQLFDRFFSTTRSGTGVGLSFCRTVMENLGGCISCQSELGEYTEFVLTFPKLNVA